MMKRKLETLKSSKFEAFKENELLSTINIVGGKPYGTRKAGTSTWNDTWDDETDDPDKVFYTIENRKWEVVTFDSTLVINVSAVVHVDEPLEGMTPGAYHLGHLAGVEY